MENSSGYRFILRYNVIRLMWNVKTRQKNDIQIRTRNRGLKVPVVIGVASKSTILPHSVNGWRL